MPIDHKVQPLDIKSLFHPNRDSINVAAHLRGILNYALIICMTRTKGAIIIETILSSPPACQTSCWNNSWQNRCGGNYRFWIKHAQLNVNDWVTPLSKANCSEISTSMSTPSSISVLLTWIHLTYFPTIYMFNSGYECCQQNRKEINQPANLVNYSDLISVDRTSTVFYDGYGHLKIALALSFTF